MELPKNYYSLQCGEADRQQCEDVVRREEGAGENIGSTIVKLPVVFPMGNSNFRGRCCVGS